jgi:hypothetical protein
MRDGLALIPCGRPTERSRSATREAPAAGRSSSPLPPWVTAFPEAAVTSSPCGSTQVPCCSGTAPSRRSFPPDRHPVPRQFGG